MKGEGRMADNEGTITEPVESAAETSDGATETKTTPIAPSGQQPAAPATGPTVPAPRPTPPADDWKPPTKEEWEKVTAGLRDASGEAAARKKKLRDLEAQLEELRLASATAEERAAKELEKRLLKEADDRWRPKVVASSVRAALTAARCNDLVRIGRLIDLAQVEIGDDGEVTGLDEQVASLKADYPEAFKHERPPAEPQAAQPGSTRASAQKLSATERQARALLGKI